MLHLQLAGLSRRARAPMLRPASHFWMPGPQTLLLHFVLNLNKTIFLAVTYQKEPFKAYLDIIILAAAYLRKHLLCNLNIRG